MASITNIKNFTQNKEISLGDAIHLLLSRKANNTRIAYQKAYNEFTEYLFNKDMLDCEWEDIQSIEYADVLKYVNTIEQKYSHNTINTRLTAFQFLARELNKIKPYCLNYSIFNVKTKKKENTEYGALTYDEIMNLLDYVKSKNTPKSMIEYLFFKTMLTTAHRVGSLLDLTWNDIKINNENGTPIAIITVYDKTGTFKTPIPMELYQELKTQLFNNENNDKVFKITNMSLSKTMKKFCEEYNIDQKERKIVVHSIKKTSGDIAYSQSGGNIVKVADHLHHSNIQTTYNYYLGKNEKYEDKLSMNILSNNLDDNLQNMLNDLSKEDIINILKNCDLYTKNNFMQNAQKINNN